ncbi:[4Fe-4S] proteins maturation [Parahypoxylon ruwenzoriense]
MPPRSRIRCTSACSFSSSSVANIFVRLWRTASPPLVPASSSILDVLLPPRARAFHLVASGRPNSCGTSGRAAVAAPPLQRQRQSQNRNIRARNTNAISARRPFSATAPWRKTEIIYNPQKDEDGDDMLLEITPRAANRLSQIMAKDKNPHLALRISVESGGCHGFQYLMSLTSLPPSLLSSSSTPQPHHPPETSTSGSSLLSPGAKNTAAEVGPSITTSASPAEPSIGEDDTIFAFVKEDGDAAAAAPQHPPPAGAPKVVLDAPSLELLKGSKVDFTMELIGSQFKIVDNPLATSSCGCGTSFDIKI